MTDDANDKRYHELMDFIFERYVRPRLPVLRSRYRHHFEDEWTYQLSRTIEATRLVRFLESHCRSDDDIYETFTWDALRQAVHRIENGCEFSERIAEEGGFLDAVTDHADEILAGLQPEFLPEIDRTILAEIGSLQPDVELRSLVQRTKLIRTRTDQGSMGDKLQHRIKDATKLLHEAAAQFDQAAEQAKEGAALEQPQKKTRRWFKGLGQIGQGAALTIGNGLLAASIIHLPVSPETQTWGSIVSIITGLGTIANGVGELYGE